MTPAHLVPVGATIRHHAGGASGEYCVLSTEPGRFGSTRLTVSVGYRDGSAHETVLTYRAGQMCEIVEAETVTEGERG